MRNRKFALFAGALILAACQGTQTPTVITVEDARVSLAAAPGVPGAGYFVIKGGSANDALVGVTSSAAERIEMHESGTDARGVTAMRPLREPPLGAAEGLVFAPGGRHLMVHGLQQDLREGQAIPLTFRFRSAPNVTIRARLLAPGAAAQGMHIGH